MSAGRREVRRMEDGGIVEEREGWSVLGGAMEEGGGV